MKVVHHQQTVFYILIETRHIYITFYADHNPLGPVYLWPSAFIAHHTPRGAKPWFAFHICFLNGGIQLGWR